MFTQIDMKKLLFLVALCAASLSATAQASLLRAAEAGSAGAQFNLGLCYDKGRCGGISKNKDEAIKWYTKSAEQGNENAQNNLAILLLKTDPKTANYWFEQSAQQGNQKAQYNLASMYSDPQFGLTNKVRAYAWLSEAAKNGFNQAQTELDRLSEVMSSSEVSQAKAEEVSLNKRVTNKEAETPIKEDEVPEYYTVKVIPTEIMPDSVPTRPMPRRMRRRR